MTSAPAPSLRQSGGRPGYQPVTNKNSICGAQGTGSTANPDSLNRIVKTVATSCGELRTLLMGFYAAPLETPLLGASAATTGIYACTAASVLAGGSGYAAGTSITFAAGSADLTPIVLRVTSVSSGAIATVEVVQRGAFKQPLVNGVAYSTAAARGGAPSAGSGATFDFTWTEFAYAANVGIEPTASNSAGSGTTALIPAGIGNLYNGSGIDTTILVPDSGFVLTDPIRLPLAAGTTIAERIGSVGAPLAYQRLVGSTDFSIAQNVPRAGALTGTPLMAGPGNSTPGTVTLGRPQQPVPWFMIVGDSINCGATGPGFDTGDAYGNIGSEERGLQLAGGYGLWSIARPSDRLSNWYGPTNSRFMRLGMLSKLTDTVDFGSCVLILALGINDLTASTASATVIGYIQQHIQDFLAFNPAGLFYETFMPAPVSSTDGFTTIANQSVSSTPDGNRKAVNAWLRGGAGGLLSGQSGRTRTGLLDRAALVEVGNGKIGVWNVVSGVGFSIDGTHPTQTTHANILAPMFQTIFTGFQMPA